MPDKPSEPWKTTLSELWETITLGRRPIAIMLVIAIFVVPGAYGLASFYWTAASAAYNSIIGAASIMSPEEENARNEWIAVVSYWASEKEAREAASTFKSLYSRYETETRLGKGGAIPMWRDDILVVRDPTRVNRWMIAIDMYYGPSSQPVVSAELARVARLGGGDPEAQNTYQRLFVSSKVLCYSEIIFEKTYGKIDPKPQVKRDHQGVPYTACAPDA